MATGKPAAGRAGARRSAGDYARGSRDPVRAGVRVSARQESRGRRDALRARGQVPTVAGNARAHRADLSRFRILRPRAERSARSAEDGPAGASRSLLSWHQPRSSKRVSCGSTRRSPNSEKSCRLRPAIRWPHCGWAWSWWKRVVMRKRCLFSSARCASRRRRTTPGSIWGVPSSPLGRAAQAVASLRRALDGAERCGEHPGADVRRRYVRYQLATALRATGASAEAEREFAEAQRLSVEQLGKRARPAGAATWPTRRRRRRRALAPLPLGIGGFEALTELRTHRARGASRRHAGADVPQPRDHPRPGRPLCARRGVVRVGGGDRSGVSPGAVLAGRRLLQRRAV